MVKKQNYDDMSVSHLKCTISNNKKLRSNIAGYSKLSRDDLIKAINTVNEGGTVSKRVVVETTWLRALNEFNKGKSGYSIPRKDSDDYKKVKEIQNSLMTTKDEDVTENFIQKRPKKLKVIKPDEEEEVEKPKSKRSKEPRSKIVIVEPEPVVEKPKYKRSKIVIVEPEPVVELPKKRVRKPKVIVDM